VTRVEEVDAHVTAYRLDLLREVRFGVRATARSKTEYRDPSPFGFAQGQDDDIETNSKAFLACVFKAAF
jgi:hypothetical protein